MVSVIYQRINSPTSWGFRDVLFNLFKNIIIIINFPRVFSSFWQHGHHGIVSDVRVHKEERFKLLMIDVPHDCIDKRPPINHRYRRHRSPTPILETRNEA